MSADAIVVFHPTDPSKLEPFLDLDEESEESEGIYAEKLDDGTYLVHTFQPFDVFLQNPDEALSWLEQFGDALEATTPSSPRSRTEVSSCRSSSRSCPCKTCRRTTPAR